MGTHYEVLGVGRLADEGEIRLAFKRRALQLHPDKGGSTEQFQNALLAFETLADPTARSAYDRRLVVASSARAACAGRPGKAWHAERRCGRRAASPAHRKSHSTGKKPSKVGGGRRLAPDSWSLAGIAGNKRPCSTMDLNGRRWAPRNRPLPDDRKRRSDFGQTWYNKIMRNVFLTMRLLDADDRRDVLKSLFTENDRRSLEAWIQASGGGTRPRGASDCCASLQTGTRPSESGSRSQSGSECEGALPLQICGEPCSDSEVDASTNTDEEPTHEAAKGPRVRKVGRRSRGNGNNHGVRGLISKEQSGVPRYFAAICIDCIEFRSKGFMELQDALDFLVLLITFKQRALAMQKGLLADKIRKAFHEVMVGQSVDLKESGLTISVRMRCRWWFRGELRVPVLNSIEKALVAWSLYDAFRAQTRARGSRLSADGDVQGWKAFCDSLLDEMRACGASADEELIRAWEDRVHALYAENRSHRERKLEAEQLRRMADEDARSECWRRHGSEREVCLARIGELLARFRELWVVRERAQRTRARDAKRAEASLRAAGAKAARAEATRAKASASPAAQARARIRELQRRRREHEAASRRATETGGHLKALYFVDA